MDLEQRFQEAVRTAAADQSPLAITGSGAKRPWLGNWSAEGQILSLADHCGVVQYQPAELVVTVRAGTPLKDLMLELAQSNQELAAEPPLLQGGGTVGGAVAAGFSGPARPWLGSVRDAVLGVKVINGQGDILNFGGQVMKNVAGYDVSRLMAGSMGSLGVILEASIRVRPRTPHQLTLAFDLDASAGVELCRSMARQPLPLSGTYWCGGRLLVRLSGSQASLQAAQQQLGGEVVDVVDMWQRVRDHTLDFFQPASLAHHDDRSEDLRLYSIITPPGAPIDELDTSELAIEWGGGRRWLWHTDAGIVADYAASVGGWVWQVGSPVSLESSQRSLMQRIKDAFDPHGIFISPTLLGQNRAD